MPTPRRLAGRTDALTQSDIRAITLLTRELGGINLGQGICDMPTPAPIREAAQAALDAGPSTYTAYNGIRPLRLAILEKAQTYNRLPAISDAEVMVSAGSTGAFVAATFALLDPGDEVILFEPYYGYHLGLLRLPGATARFVKLRRDGDVWAFDADALEAAITPRTKAVVICTPANPCGKVWTRAELEALLAILERHNLYAITDEIYEHMLYDGRTHVSLASLPGAYERTVTISGFSKTYNMTGWRLGYAVAPPPLIEPMGLLNDLFYICAPAPLQHGVTAAFGMDEAYFAEMTDAYARKRQMLGEALEAAGFEVPWPEGAYYILADFRRLAETHEGFGDDKEACETLIRRAGVASIPGRSFFSDPADGRTCLRFCYAKEFDVLEQACDRLVEAFGA